MVEGRLKDAQEEADKEKALKQVVEASLKEKTSGLNVMERYVMTVEKAMEIAEQKANEASSKLGEIDLKLPETANLLFAWDKEFSNYKGGKKAWKQSYYDRDFRHIENSARPMIFQAQKFGFIEGWMVVVNAIGLPTDSPFKSIEQVPLLEDLVVRA